MLSGGRYGGRMKVRYCFQMKLLRLSAETSFVEDPISSGMPARAVTGLINDYKKSERRRHRYCFHQSPTVDLHDIVICYDSDSYIPPNKHVGKSESLLVIDGEIDLFLFSDNGQVYDYRRLSASDCSQAFYVRIPPNTWHGLRAVGLKPCIIKETISGPYDGSTLKWASFAPSEAKGKEAGLQWYDKVMEYCVNNGIGAPENEEFEKVNDTVYRSSRQLITVSLNQLKVIVEAAQCSNLKRARLCCHNGPEEKLQEMFIALASGVDIDESVHIRKDESLTVIMGKGRYKFPNEDGSIRKEIKLAAFSGSNGSEDYFFSRINRYVPHKIIVDEDTLLIHEATTGPFIRSDTDYRIKGIEQ